MTYPSVRRHTVEELQKFGQTKTPSPPWVLTHRVLIPINPSCSDAADLLIRALGGPENAFKLCGGTKWWTVRLQRGVEGEWIGIKKDWRKEEERVRKEDERRKKGRAEKVKDHVEGKTDDDDGQEGECAYLVTLCCNVAHRGWDLVTPEMDHLRCMMYIPGG